MYCIIYQGYHYLENFAFFFFKIIIFEKLRLPEYMDACDLLMRNSCSKYFGSQIKYPTNPRMVNTLLAQEASSTGLRKSRTKADLKSSKYYMLLERSYVYVDI